MPPPILRLSLAELAADRGSQITISYVITFALASILLLLRIYCRRLTKQRLWWDDYLIIVAYVNITSF